MALVLPPRVKCVETGKPIGWLIRQNTAGIAGILQYMRKGIILDGRAVRKRVVIDTKFAWS